MITVGFSTKNDNPQFVEYIQQTCGLKNIQVIQKINPKLMSLSEAYNQILDESTNDIVVICHDDIKFEEKYWGKRVLEHFDKHNDYGILGVAGTMYYPESGRWWEIPSEMVGQVYHEHNGKRWLSEYNKPFVRRIIDTIIVDGLFIAINKKNIKHNFDLSVSGFHFYDTTFCFKNYIDGVKIGTISNIPITHLSIGMTNNEWEINRELFIDKFRSNLPAKLKTILPEYKINPKLPLVSIIIPIHNYGLVFHKTLESVFNSTYKNFEVIIVSDGATNNYVVEKLKSLEYHPQIKIIYQDNKGPSSARNLGVDNTSGKYVLPLDADDTIHPEYIQNCVNILNNNNKISPVYCDTVHLGQIQGIEKRPEWSLDRLKMGPFIVNCSMFHKDAFYAAGKYDENLIGWEDYDLWIRMALNGYTGKRIPKALFNYYHHEKDGTVSTIANQNQIELYNKIMNKNFKDEIV